MAGGGPDCFYESVVIGAVKGQPKVLTPEPRWSNVEEGVSIGDLVGSHGYGLVRWNFIWADKAHYQPNRFEVSIFRFASAEPQFKLGRKVLSKGRHSTGKELLAKMGRRCRNSLCSFPGFGC